MFSAIQPPLKLSFLSHTLKEGTYNRGLFNSLWEGGKGARPYSWTHAAAAASLRKRKSRPFSL